MTASTAPTTSPRGTQITAILGAVSTNPNEPSTAGGIAKATGYSRKRVAIVLAYLTETKQIQRVDRGLYAKAAT